MAHENNSETLRSYKLGVKEYVTGAAAEVTGNFKLWIDAMLSRLDKQARILEIGSGFGRDARYIESQGYSVCNRLFSNMLRKTGVKIGNYIAFCLAKNACI